MLGLMHMKVQLHMEIDLQPAAQLLVMEPQQVVLLLVVDNSNSIFQQQHHSLQVSYTQNIIDFRPFSLNDLSKLVFFLLGFSIFNNELKI